MNFPFIGASYLSASTNFDNERCVNLQYVSGESGNSKSPAMLVRTPGLPLLASLDGSNGIRALHTPTDGGDMIAVQGSSVYRVARDWTFTHVGDIDLLPTPVIIKDDGGTAVLTTGPNGYTLALGSNTLVSMAGFHGSRHVCYNDNSFIFSQPGTRQFYITGAGVLTLDALDFASAESNAEPIVSMIVNHGELILFKKTVTEVWRDSGNADFPYARNVNAAIEQGCTAPYSVVDIDNTVFWLGGDKSGSGIIWRLNGYTPLRVSTEGVERAIQGYSDLSDAVAYTCQQNGHSYYVISFPTGNATWVYDVKESKWHERSYTLPSTGMYQRHRSSFHAYFNGKHVVGDWENGNLYALDYDYYSDNGDPLVALRSSPYIADPDYKEIRFDSFYLDFEAGVGLQSGQGSNSQMMIRWSKNGGKTWSRPRIMNMGEVGDYMHRAYVKRMGKARTMSFEVSVSDPVKIAMFGASVQALVLTR